MECVMAWNSQLSPSWQNQAREEGRSARYFSLPFDAVENHVSQLGSSMMGGDEWMRVEPANPGGLVHDDESALEIRALLKKQLKAGEFESEYDCLLRQLAITGNCPVTTFWRREYAVDYPAYAAKMREWNIQHGAAFSEHMARMQEWTAAAAEAAKAGQQAPPMPFAQMPEPPPSEVSKTIASQGPRFQCGDIFNCVVDPFSVDSEHPLIIKRTFVSKSVLQRLARKNRFGYSVYDNIQNVTETDMRHITADDFFQERYKAFGLRVPDFTGVELLEAWGTMEIPNGHLDGRSTFVSFCAVIANRQTLIRFEPTFLASGKSPLFLATYRRPEQGQVYGIGQIEPHLDIADLVNVRTNQVVDVAQFTINPNYKGIDDGLIPKRIRSSSGSVTFMESLDNLEPIKKDFAGIRIGMDEVQLLSAWFREMTHAQVSSIPGGPQRSATNDAIKAAGISVMVSKVAKHIERSALAEILSRYIEMDVQYLNDNEIVEYTHKGATRVATVSPDKWRRGWVVTVNGTQYAVDKQDRIQNKMMFYNMANASAIGVAAINQLEYLKSLYRDLGLGDETEIFNTTEEAHGILMSLIANGLIGGGRGQAGAGGGQGGGPQGGGQAGVQDAGVSTSTAGDREVLRAALDASVG